MPHQRSTIWSPALTLLFLAVLVTGPRGALALGSPTEMLILDGRLYAKAQFDPGSFMEPNCDEDHWHKAGGAPVTAIDGTMRTDPNPTACGFGRVSEIPQATIQLVDSSAPLAADDTVAAGEKVFVAHDATVNVPIGITLTIDGEIKLYGGIATDDGTVDINLGGKVTVSSTGSIFMCPSGVCPIDGGGVVNVSGLVFNFGSVTVLDGSFNILPGGRFTNFRSATINNQDELNIDGSLLNLDGSILGNDPTGTITNSDNTIENFGTFTNDGTIDNTAGTINNHCNGSFTNNGTLNGNPVNTLGCACDDGLDNDGDGLLDWDGAGMGGPDPGCLDAQGTTESPGCSDGDDNDGDGLIDHDGGAGASQSAALCLGAGDPFDCCTGPTAGCAGSPDPQCVASPGKEDEECGNGTVDPGEACDDGNLAAGDCCDALCQTESGSGSPSCCDNGLCQAGDPCGVVCFGSPAVCAVGAGGACLCVVAPSPSCGSCLDPTRTLFVGEAGTQACSTYNGDQANCEKAWLCSGSGNPATCWYDSGFCLGCGPNNENAGLCTNTCTP